MSSPAPGRMGGPSRTAPIRGMLSHETYSPQWPRSKSCCTGAYTARDKAESRGVRNTRQAFKLGFNEQNAKVGVVSDGCWLDCDTQ